MKEIIKEKALTLIIGGLIGAIIASTGFIIYNKINNKNKKHDFGMPPQMNQSQSFNHRNGRPSKMPSENNDSQNNGTPPELPNGETPNGNNEKQSNTQDKSQT